MKHPGQNRVHARLKIIDEFTKVLPYDRRNRFYQNLKKEFKDKMPEFFIFTIGIMPDWYPYNSLIDYCWQQDIIWTTFQRGWS